MSDDPREAQRKMKRIFLCNDIWFDCLPWLSRAKVGFEFALVSDRFDALADAHLGSKKRQWTLGDLVIRQGIDQNEAIIVKNRYTENVEHLPLPDGLLPENVVGFQCIRISYIDHHVMDFLRRIRRLFQPTNNGGDDGIGLASVMGQARSWDIVCDSIWPLIDPLAITKLSLSNDSFDALRQRISPTFLLTDLANVRVVSILYAMPLGDGPNGQLLREWLHTPRADGQPKLVTNCYMDSDAVVDELKMKFLSAETAAIMKGGDQQTVPFVLDNLCTGERLTFREVGTYSYKWLLERGPIGGRNVEKWTKWVREAMGMEQEHNVLLLGFGDTNIGPLSPP